MPGRHAPALLLFSLIAYCPLSRAQKIDILPISTDRPSVGSGTDLVPVGAMQFENGVSWTRDQGSSSIDGPESLIRIGLSERVELQATLPNMQRPGVSSGVGFNDSGVGVKVKIGSDARKWPLAIVGSMSFPTGSVDLTSGGVDPAILVAVGHTLPLNLQFSGSANLTSLSSKGQGRVARSQMAFSLNWCANPRTCFFGEAAPYVSTAQTASGWTYDGGMTLRVAPLLQVDWRAGTTVQDGDSSIFVSVGYSLRRDRVTRIGRRAR
jgi:hypothetical protein